MFDRRVDFAAYKSTFKKLWVVYLWNQDAYIFAPLVESSAFSSDEGLGHFVGCMVWYIFNGLR